MGKRRKEKEKDLREQGRREKEVESESFHLLFKDEGKEVRRETGSGRVVILVSRNESHCQPHLSFPP
jgi:hypothetical protein